MLHIMSRERKLELHQLEGTQRARIEEAIKKRVDELLASQEVQKQIEVCNPSHLLISHRAMWIFNISMHVLDVDDAQIL